MGERGPILKNGSYYYRRRVPDDVRQAMRALDAQGDGRQAKHYKREEKKALGRNKAYAEAAWKKHDRAVEAKWMELRSGRAAVLTPVHLKALAGEIHRRWLKL